MLIGIVGLGLIGGSFAKAYHEAGHRVAATDTDTQTLSLAKIMGITDEELSPEIMKDCDLILLCVYPEAAIEFIRENGRFFGKKPIVMDTAGTKRRITKEGMELAKKLGFTFVGGHPMAGTQYSGLKYSRANMFHGAPMVIVPPTFGDIELLERIKALLSPCGFSRVTVTTAEKHDETIAYTSQLPHVVSSAFIKSPSARAHRGVSAGSYKDMTRVAWLSPEMWTELCLDNRDNLIRETEELIKNLAAYRDALAEGDGEKLKALFYEGKKIKYEIDGNTKTV